MHTIQVYGTELAEVAGATDLIRIIALTGKPGIPAITLNPVQVAGLIPLLPCDSFECREICGDGWKNPVFGELIDESYQTLQTYENDWNAFTVDVSMYQTLSVTVVFLLEKFLFEQWTEVAELSDPFYSDAYGKYYALGAITGHPTYARYEINWGAVLSGLGAGCYRIKVTTTFTTGVTGPPPAYEEPHPTTYTGCLQTPIFDLKEWNCFRAHGTVKFETWLSGIIGDPYTDYKKHDLCGITLYDSLRTYGFIHYPKSPEYLTNNLKWGSPQQGKIEKVNDEQIQRWEYNSKYLPEWLHTRFSTFAMMSDKLFASDYNINNSDYTIKRKNFIYDSGYEPETIDKEAFWQRRNKIKVNMFFKRGVQSVMKSLCCENK